MTNRLVPIQELIASYKKKYSNVDSFLIHPGINFVASSDGGGITVKANQSIPKGNPIMVIPETERVSMTNVFSSSLRKVLKDVKSKFHKFQNSTVPTISGNVKLDDVYRYGDIGLAIVIMHDLTQQGQNSQTSSCTKTCPSLHDLQQYYYPLWFGVTTDSTNFGEQLGNEMNQWLKGTPTYELMGKYAKCLRYAFDKVVHPILSKQPLRDYVIFVCKFVSTFTRS